jgi:Ras-related protein Rab-5C
MAKTIDEINIKIALLGLGGVGKTSIVHRFMGKGIPDRYIPTIGHSINKQEYELIKGDLVIRINIWDLGGQRSFNLVNPSSFTNIDAAFLVFDLSKPDETIKELKQFYVKNLEKYSEGCQIIVIGNKLDLYLDRKKELGKNLEKYFQMDNPLVLTSAKSGKNIEAAFELLIYTFLEAWEIKDAEDDYRGIAKSFLNYINKTEEKLMNLFVSINDIENIDFETEKEPHITKKVVAESQKEESDLEKYISIQRGFKELELMRGEIIGLFSQNLGKVENLILNLKKSPIDSLIDVIEHTKEELANIKEEFKSELDSIMNLENKKEEKE